MESWVIPGIKNGRVTTTKVTHSTSHTILPTASIATFLSSSLCWTIESSTSFGTGKSTTNVYRKKDGELIRGRHTITTCTCRSKQRCEASIRRGLGRPSNLQHQWQRPVQTTRLVRENADKARQRGCCQVGPEYPDHLTQTCRLLGVSRAEFYEAKRRAAAPMFCKASVHLRAAFMSSGQSYGSRRLVTALANRGLQVGRYKVRRLMQQACLKPVWKRKFVHTTDSKHACRLRQTSLPDSSTRQRPIRLMPRISRTSVPARAGSTWLSCSTCSRAESWAGQWRRACQLPWFAMPCAWRSKRGDQRPDWSSTLTAAANMQVTSTRLC
jgi:hypothetical protein